MNNLKKEDIQVFEDHLRIDTSVDKRMKTDCIVYVDKDLRDTLFSELNSISYKASLQQLSEVASLPGLVRSVIGLPDMHSGYGFPIGCVAAFDLNNPDARVIPGGVGYDINCGVRALKTNLDISDLIGKEEKLADLLFETIPSGIGVSNNSKVTLSIETLNSILDQGLNYLVKSKMASPDNLECTESNGCVDGSSKLVSQKAKGKGTNQLGTIGSGNHYLEVQYVSDIYDEERAQILGISKNQIIISIHTGSRGLGHTVCQDSIMEMSDGDFNDELVSLLVESELSQNYLLRMGSASNFAFCNRAMIAESTKKAFEKVFDKAELELIYDVSHNIAKKEEYMIDGEIVDCLVHRKGASRALEPHNKELPSKYSNIGQPLVVGGSMGTCSFLLCGDVKSVELTFRSTCHGAGRLLSRNQSRKAFTYDEIMNDLKSKNILIRSGTSKGVVEEAPGSYKDVEKVVNISDQLKIAKKVCKLKPMIVIKG